MQNINIKLVIFRITAENLVVYAPDGKLPSEKISQTTPLDIQVEKIFYKNLGFSIGNNYVEQLYTISDDKNEINIVYFVLLSKQNEQINNSLWTPAHTAKNKIISYATQRLQWKIEYTNVIYSLLPEEFTLSDLQKTYEAILEKKLDKRNFRKKILSLKFLKPTGKKRISNARPALTYTFTTHSPLMIKVFS